MYYCCCFFFFCWICKSSVCTVVAVVNLYIYCLSPFSLSFVCILLLYYENDSMYLRSRAVGRFQNPGVGASTYWFGFQSAPLFGKGLPDLPKSMGCKCLSPQVPSVPTSLRSKHAGEELRSGSDLSASTYSIAKIGRATNGRHTLFAISLFICQLLLYQ